MNFTVNMTPKAEIKMPRSWTGGPYREVAMQRTCALVDEWSERNGAKVEVQMDEDVISAVPSKLIEQSLEVTYRRVERRYRVAKSTESAKDEMHKIGGMMNRIRVIQEGLENAERLQRITEIVLNAAQWLLDAGYSEVAIREVFNAKITLPAGIPGK